MIPNIEKITLVKIPMVEDHSLWSLHFLNKHAQRVLHVLLDFKSSSLQYMPLKTISSAILLQMRK